MSTPAIIAVCLALVLTYLVMTYLEHRKLSRMAAEAEAKHKDLIGAVKNAPYPNNSNPPRNRRIP